VALSWSYRHALPMLIEPYIEGLLVDETLADEVCALWDEASITDEIAAWAWWPIADLHMFSVETHGLK
jgi:hypothetical protein